MHCCVTNGPDAIYTLFHTGLYRTGSFYRRGSPRDFQGTKHILEEKGNIGKIFVGAKREMSKDTREHGSPLGEPHRSCFTEMAKT